MNAKTVYDVAKALSKEAQRELFYMLKKDFSIATNQLKKHRKPVLTKEDAYLFLLKNVFNQK